MDDSSCILDNLRVVGGSSLSEWLNDGSDEHLLELFSAFLVNTEITDGEKSDSSW